MTGVQTCALPIFTQGLLRAAEACGASVVKAAVDGLLHGPAGTVTGVHLDSGETIAGDAVVIAMGPWSVLASRWLSLPAVHGVKGHSLVFGPGGRKLDGALFLEVDDSHGTVLTPEIFPRADGTVWACAISSTPPLPVDPAEVAPDEIGRAHV